MIKFSLSAFMCLVSSALFSQNTNTVVKYFDAAWAPTSRDDAYYLTKFIKQDTLYQCISYQVESGKIITRSFFADTTFTHPRGIQIRYYEDGKVSDSISFYNNGDQKFVFHYYPDGKLRMHYTFDNRTMKATTKGYDEQGNVIRGFVYMREASFPGGLEEWRDYISKNIRIKVPIKNHAPPGTYHVSILFKVDKEGNVTDIEPKTNFGYGMEEEAMRVIKRSRKWNNAIYLNQPVHAYRVQPITFLVPAKKY